MFARLIFTIVALGACCCTLLFLRQGRILAASDMAKVQTRVRQQDEELWKLRVRIAEKVAPQHVTIMAQTSSGVGPLHPIAPQRPLLATDYQTPQPIQGAREVVVVGQTATDENKAEARKNTPAKSTKSGKPAVAPGKPKKGKNTPALPGKPTDSRLAKKEPGSVPR